MLKVIKNVKIFNGCSHKSSSYSVIVSMIKNILRSFGLATS